MDNIDFAQFFNEKLKSKGLSLKKLADVSGIPMKHLQNLGEGRYQDLPPAPYLRGYIVSLGTILGFDGLAAWEHFKYLPAIESSGGLDALPKNRFAQRSSTMYAMSGFAALLLVGYLGFRFSNIFGRPILEIGYPQEALVRSMGANVTAYGTLENGDTVFVNGESLPLGEDGTWEKRLLLQPGLNSIEVSAKKFLGGETRILRQVIYEPAALEPAPTGSSAEVIR
jgi:transcriptional regulator with XRE-family HTH domain